MHHLLLFVLFFLGFVGNSSGFDRSYLSSLIENTCLGKPSDAHYSITCGDEKLSFCYTGYKPDVMKLAQQAYTSFNYKNLSDEQVVQHIDQIASVSGYFLLPPKQVVAELRILIEKEIEQHKPYIDQNYDVNNFKKGIIYICGAIACINAMHILHTKWIKPKQDALKLMAEKASKIGIYITKEELLDTVTYKLMGPTNLSEEQFSFAKEYFYEHTPHLDWEMLLSKTGVLLTGIGSVFTVGKSLQSMYRWIFPNHKAQYEKMCLIKEKIDLRLQTI